MSQLMEEGPLRDAAILTRAVENVFRKLIRLLVGRMSLIKMQEMIRVIFVEEARAKIQKESSSEKVPLTKLALLSGLDTRTLSRICQSLPQNQPLHKEERFLREITPECSILDYWGSNPTYLQNGSEIPLVLKIKGKRPSFDSLIKEVLTTRGVTASSLLERLESSKSVEIDAKNQSVKMLNWRYWPIEQKDETATIEIGMISVGNLIDTIVHNIETADQDEDSYFQRATWTHRLNRKDQHRFRRLIRGHLSAAEKGAGNLLKEFEENENGEHQITAGVSLFYFEEQPD